MLTLGKQLALSCPWWSWDSQLIRKALWAAVLVRLRTHGTARLKENGLTNRFPMEWRDLAFLRREPKTHRRVFDGKTNLCPELLLGYASVLGISTAECFPHTIEWIAEAAVYLTEFAPQRVRAVSLEDARVYVPSVLPIVACQPRTAACIEVLTAQWPAAERTTALAVADALAPILEAHDPERPR